MSKLRKVAIFGIIVQIGGIIYGIVNNAEDVLIISIIFLVLIFIIPNVLLNKKK